LRSWYWKPSHVSGVYADSRLFAKVGASPGAAKRKPGGAELTSSMVRSVTEAAQAGTAA
jgi:hypothetical protein